MQERATLKNDLISHRLGADRLISSNEHRIAEPKAFDEIGIEED